MLFLTHHKCGSAWLTGLLHAHYADRLRAAVYHADRSDEFPDDPAAYRYCALINADYPFLKDRIGRAVHVVRNPLAIVVSAYFSHLLSHPTDRWPHLAAQRERLRGLSKEDGLRATFDFVSSPTAFDHRAVGPLWGLAHFDYDDDRILTLRMEDLVAYPAVVLPQAFEFLGEPCPAELLARLDEHAFERKTGGRQPGDVDPAAHYRSGNPSDWVQHLSFDAARVIYGAHADFMDRFYPESAALLRAGSVPQSGAARPRGQSPSAPAVHVRAADTPTAHRHLPWEKVIHFHLPKTGGTSLNRWLDMSVPAGRARPPDRGEVLAREISRFSPPLDPSLSRAEQEKVKHVLWHRYLGREARGHWGVIHDHAPRILTTDPSAYRVVVLRNPIERFLSFLRDWRRLNDADLTPLPPDRRQLRVAARDLDANEFVRRFSLDPELPQLTQTWALVRTAAFVLPSSSGSGLLGVAQDALSRLFDFVGITEQMDLVAQCIASDLGLPAPEAVGRWNVGAASRDGDSLNAETKARLEELLADDLALYATAQAHFQDRLRRLAEHPYGERQFEDLHLRERLARLVPRFIDSTSCFSFDDAIVGSGFHGREGQGTDAVCVWTGPGTRSVLYCPVPSGEEILFFIDVGGAITPAVRQSLRIRVDGRETEVRSQVSPEGLERVLVAVTTTRPFVKVELEVTSTHSPRELGYPGQDARLLGLNLRGYGFSLVPETATVPTMLGIPLMHYGRSLEAAIAPSKPRAVRIPTPARETADGALLDGLSRELDALDGQCRMDGPFERIEPFIVDHEQLGRRFRIIAFNRQTRDYFSPLHQRPRLQLLAGGFLKPGDVALDIGCGAGFFSVWLALAVGPQGRVLAFDPHPWNAAAARASARLNGLGNMQVTAAGLSDHRSVRRLWNGLARPIDVPWCPDVVAPFEAIGDYAVEAPTFILMHAAGEEHALAGADWSLFPRLERMLVTIDPADYRDRGLCPRESLSRFAQAGFLIRLGNPGAKPLDPASAPIDTAGFWFLERRPTAPARP